MADNFHVSTSLSVMSVIAFTMAMFLM
jgi:hypothetical protein